MIDIYCVPRIVLGAGKLAALPELSAQLGPRVLVVYNGGEGTYRKVADTLGHSPVALTPFRQKGEPTVANVDAALEAARRADCAGVIGLGGGSAIDLAKAVAGLLGNGGSALDYMEVIGRGQKITRPAFPWIAIPTTAGTGAEATRNAVIGEPAKKFKASLRSEFLLPRVALVDPALAVAVPPDVTAASGMDALCQCIESFTSNGAQNVTDSLAIRGIQLASRSLRRAFTNGDDLKARTDMAEAALISGITLTNAGLGAVHGFAAPLGANYPVPHGVVCAALLSPVLKANIAAIGAASAIDSRLSKYVLIGRLLSGDHQMDDDDALNACVELTAALTHDLKIPPLRQYGLTPQGIPEMVVLAKKASSMRFNPVVLDDTTLAQILETGIAGPS